MIGKYQDINNYVDLELFSLLEAFTNLQIIKEIMDSHKINFIADFRVIKIIEVRVHIIVEIMD